MSQRSLFRPLYESDEDRTSEQRIGAVLIERWQLTEVRKLPISYGMDFALKRGQRGQRELLGFAEIKSRNLPVGYGDGYYISVLKAVAAEQLADVTGLPCFLVIELDDDKPGERRRGVWKALFGAHDKSRVILAGRTDRGDAADIEPHVVFPWRAFSRIA